MHLVLKLVVFHCYVSLPEGKVCFGIWGSTVNLKLTGSNAWCCSQGCSISSWVAWILDIQRPKRSKRGLFFAPNVYVFSRRMEQKPHKKIVGFAQHQSNIISQTTQKTVCFLKKTPWCLRSAQFGAWEAEAPPAVPSWFWFWGGGGVIPFKKSPSPGEVSETPSRKNGFFAEIALENFGKDCPAWQQWLWFEMPNTVGILGWNFCRAKVLQFESILLVNIVSLPGNPFMIWVLQTPAFKKSRSSCRMWRERGREEG